jgi:hypothetical protein
MGVAKFQTKYYYLCFYLKFEIRHHNSQSIRFLEQLPEHRTERIAR